MDSCKKQHSVSKPTDIIMELLKEFEYKNTNDTIFALIETVNGKEELSMESVAFRNIIANHYFQKTFKTVNPSLLKSCISCYYGYLYETLLKTTTRFRIFMEDDNSAIYIDKGDKDYHYYKITVDGWSEETGGDKYFKRSPSTAELPSPSRKGNVKRLFKYCRIPDKMKNVFIAFVVSCFIDIQHPCLVIQGEAGSSKTTQSKILKMLIDPCTFNEPHIFPKNAEELKDIYTQMYLASYDNLDRLTRKQSDFLCSAITGVQLIRRKLFTNSESCSYFLRQPIILNGISGIVSKEDLMSRSIVLTLPKLLKSERKSERLLMKEYKEDLPVILGGIFDILSEMLGTYKEETFDDTPRMADFYEFGYYICEAYGKGDDFCKEYLSLVDNQEKHVSAENANLFGLIDALMEENENYWYDTVGHTWEELKEYSYEYDISMPNAPNKLSKELSDCKKYLEENGIKFEFSRDSENCRCIEIYRRSVEKASA